jgi:hypothetical protein
MIGLVYIYIYVYNIYGNHNHILMGYIYPWFYIVYISHQIPPMDPMDKTPWSPRRVAADQHHLHHGAQTVLVDDAGRLKYFGRRWSKIACFFREKIMKKTNLAWNRAKNMSLFTNGLILPDARNKNEDLTGGQLVGTECPKHANMLMAEKAGPGKQNLLTYCTASMPGPKNGKLFCLKTQRNVGATGKAENQIIYCSCHLNLESRFQVIPHCRTGSNSRFQ